MKKHIKKKTHARRILLQKLYAMHINHNEKTEEDHIFSKLNINKIDLIYLKYSLKKIIEKTNILNLIIATYTQKGFDISIIEIIILKIATFEMFYNKKLPNKVIINESIILAKQFCTKNSHTIINKILDNML